MNLYLDLNLVQVYKNSAPCLDAHNAVRKAPIARFCISTVGCLLRKGSREKKKEKKKTISLILSFKRSNYLQQNLNG